MKNEMHFQRCKPVLFTVSDGDPTFVAVVAFGTDVINILLVFLFLGTVSIIRIDRRGVIHSPQM